MRKIVDYSLEQGLWAQELEAKIRHGLQRGWELYGTPFHTKGQVNQAMVRYEEAK